MIQPVPLPDRRELAARLGLLATPGLTPAQAYRLLETHHSARAAHDALRSECGAQTAAAARSEPVRERVRRALAAIRRDGILVIACVDPVYPARLTQRLGAHAPPLLFARGRVELLQLIAVAIVGSRQATEYGLDIAGEIGGAVARAGGCAVSGVALGIDAAAQTAALDAGGASIGVLGCGVDVYYPRANTTLQDRLARDGLLLSELLPGEPPRRHQFPHRNRIIAALASEVVIVEAGVRSGALTTARHALDMGTDPLCVMHAMDRPNAQGIIALVRDGAHIYTGVRDLLESAGLLQIGAAVPVAADALAGEWSPPGARHARVWRALCSRPRHIDRIARLAGLTAGEALALLLELELDGRVRQAAGQWFSRLRPASRPAAVAP